MNKHLLRFGWGNAKLGARIATFSLPAGHTCPGASACLAKADRETGRITDGPRQSFRCFAASMEWKGSVRNARWHNFGLLKAKTRGAMAALIAESLVEAPIIRIHVGGDFFSEAYFLAWCDVAKSYPAIKFYAYTKSLSFWVKNRALVPLNLRLTASEGGKHDELLKEHNLKTAKVVMSFWEAQALGLAIDHDDSHAYDTNESFALLIHGTQAKASVAAKALASLRAQGWKGYSKAA